jgi:hypothetical protein
MDVDFKPLPGTISRIRINGKESEFGPSHPRSVTFVKRTGDTTKHIITENNYVYVTGDPVNITAKDGTKITTSKFEFTTNDKPTSQF